MRPYYLALQQFDLRSACGRAAAADWCLEREDPIGAAWIAAGERIDTIASESGYGYGSGYGDGSGDGSGSGYGDGYGDGSGSGSGYGSGYESGYGYGSGDGSGDGSGYGYGDGSGDGEPNKPKHLQEWIMPAIGEYVIVRSRDQGVVLGVYAGHNGREVTLHQARQLYRWTGGNRLTLIDIAVMGLPKEARISSVAEEIIMLEACGIIAVAEEHVADMKTRPADPVNS